MEAVAIEDVSGPSRRLAGRALRELPGYGVRWDPDARCYRVRNEVTGEWLRSHSTGELASFRSFCAAFSAWRVFEVHKRLGE
ncbi:hypothetical protein PUR71_02165 [Streptomyces sp. SP17BM10]|uniref:hypothetical protein n=1 Tax=Streptomyces sp. SP17BM10 TaxID=3002530 RepID=UPI002E762D8A|nr:hypothetical protein [Streptomyces sp. SP17BM10]MEE1781742.1 hypothetical protein [Streptomyces sp. SP17BM10]